jgi:hypothetical protein
MMEMEELFDCVLAKMDTYRQTDKEEIRTNQAKTEEINLLYLIWREVTCRVIYQTCDNIYIQCYHNTMSTKSNVFNNYSGLC